MNKKVQYRNSKLIQAGRLNVEISQKITHEVRAANLSVFEIRPERDAASSGDELIRRKGNEY